VRWQLEMLVLWPPDGPSHGRTRAKGGASWGQTAVVGQLALRSRIRALCILGGVPKVLHARGRAYAHCVSTLAKGVRAVQWFRRHPTLLPHVGLNAEQAVRNPKTAFCYDHPDQPSKWLFSICLRGPTS
jgi:hypothetical protein